MSEAQICIKVEEKLLDTIKEEVRLLRKLYKVIGKNSKSPPSLENYQRWKSLKEKILYLDFLEPPQTLETLPGTKVKHGNIEYVIHGICHDGYKPEDKLSQQVRRFYSENILEFNKPEIGEDYICEEGLSKSLGLNVNKEINDVTYYDDLSVTMVSTVPLLSLIWDMIQLWYYNKTKVRAEYSEHIKVIRNRVEDIFIKAGRMSLKDTRYLTKTREIYNALTSDFSFLLGFYKGDVIWSAYTNTKREMYMAQFSKDYSMIRGLRKLHLIVGLTHELGVSKFLRFPEDDYLKEVEKIILSTY